MKIEKITTQNYNILVSWYDGWQLPRTPYHYIPKNAYLVDNICAGFVFQMDATPMWYIEGIISNPEIKDKDLKRKALNVLINTLLDVVKKNDGELIISSTPRETLKSTFFLSGFNVASEKYFHLARFV